MIQHIKKLIKKDKNLSKYAIDIEENNNVITLNGEVDTWSDVVAFGHLVGSLEEVKGVINNLRIPGQNKNRSTKVKTDMLQQNILRETEVLIVGGGITGCGIARELSRYNLDITLIEKNADIASGTTKANNGMVHSGYAAAPGSLKAELNVKGNAKYDKWSEDLKFKFVRSGSFVVGFNEEDEAHIKDYYEKGKKNNVPGIEILTGDEAREIENNLSSKVSTALWTPSAGYVAPYEVALALADNAVENGAELLLETELLAVDYSDSKINKVYTNRGIIKCSYLINAAGVYADEVAEMAGDRQFTIHPRRGTLIIFDKEKEGIVERAVGTTPSEHTKGGVAQQTPEGNPLWGPTAVEVPDKENKAVSQEDIDTIMDKFTSIVEGINSQDIITMFSGVRASNYKEDFVIEASKNTIGLIQAAAVQSPGLASSPAIAERIVEIFLEEEEKNNLLKRIIEENPNFNGVRKVDKAFHDCSWEEKQVLLEKDPAYGHLVCRCEYVTEAEIVKAVHSNVPAHTMDAVKRRTRAGMGRCQAGFCGPRVLKILARELDKDPTEITKKGGKSNVLNFKIKDLLGKK